MFRLFSLSSELAFASEERNLLRKRFWSVSLRGELLLRARLEWRTLVKGYLRACACGESLLERTLREGILAYLFLLGRFSCGNVPEKSARGG